MIYSQAIYFTGISNPVMPDCVPLVRAKVGLGVDVAYVILGADGVQWERGEGQIGVGGELTRASVAENHLGGAALVEFGLGRHLVAVFEIMASAPGGSGLTHPEVMARGVFSGPF